MRQNFIYIHTHIHMYICIYISFEVWIYCCSVAKSCLTLCDPMDCRILYLPLSFGVCSNSYRLSWWYHPTASTSAAVFFFCLQSFLASGSFEPMSWLFSPSGQSIEVSASVSVLPVNIQGWFPLGLTGLISLLSRGLSRVFISTTVWKHQFFDA